MKVRDVRRAFDSYNHELCSYEVDSARKNVGLSDYLCRAPLDKGEGDVKGPLITFASLNLVSPTLRPLSGIGKFPRRLGRVRTTARKPARRELHAGKNAFL